MAKNSWSLINDNITQKDKEELIEFLSEPGVRLTQSENVRKFEERWSEWLGVKHTVFVNSGASANYIMASIVKETKGVGEVIVPPIGWVSDVAPLVNLGMTPVFVDVSLDNLAMTVDNIRSAITDKTVAITLVHALGFNALNREIINIAKENDILLIEDCCESHGATFEGQKVGTFGDMSNFSFYFGHHMTTIEGGVVCTNDDDLYDYIKMFRSHGMIRDASDKVKQRYKSEKPDLNPLFTFAVPGYNLRSCELNAVIGLSQIKRLDSNIEKRIYNLNVWVENLDSSKYFTEFDLNGNSNFSLPLNLLEEDANKFNSICQILTDNGIEFRKGTAGGGNQVRQPYLEKYSHRVVGSMKNANHIHDFGLYVGNHTEVSEEQIKDLCSRLNEV